MAKIGSVGLVPGPPPNEIEIRKLTTKLGNSFVRRTAAERRGNANSRVIHLR